MSLQPPNAFPPPVPPPAKPPGTDGSTRDMLRQLELEVTRRLDGLLHGNHQGLVPGHGTDLGDTHAYRPGDDVRRIDWNVTARSLEPHVRNTIAERELRTWLVVDRSSRLDFGSALTDKRTLAQSAAAAFGFLGARDDNRMGLVLIGRGDPTVIPCDAGRNHLMHLLDTIHRTPTGDGSGVTDLSVGLGRVANLAKHRGMVVVISDFLVADGWQHALGTISRRHDVVAVQVTDPLEHVIPNVGMVTFEDPATGEQFEVDTGKRSLREAYLQMAALQQAQLREMLAFQGVDLLTLSTDSDWLLSVVAFVAQRSRRIVRGVRPRQGAAS